MALTRALLKSLGLEDNAISAIIEAHTESTEALKTQRDEAMARATKYTEMETELTSVKNQLAEANGWKTKYDEASASLTTVQNEFEQYKTNEATQKTNSAKETALKAMLKEIGLTDKRIETVMRVTKLDDIKLNNDGSLHDIEKMKTSYAEEYAEFIPQTQTEGAHVANPPSNTGGAMTKAQIMAITDRAARRKAIAENPDAFK